LKNPFDQREIYDVLDLCLSCKACKSECPSNVDMAKLKAEFMQHWYEHNGIPLRSRLIAGISGINRLGMLVPGLFNRFVTGRFTGKVLKRVLGFAISRSIPTLSGITLRKWARRHLVHLNSILPADAPEILLYVDEFTNYNDSKLGICAIRMLNRSGTRVRIIRHPVSARTYISKGLLKKAKKLARRNVTAFSGLVTAEMPLVGLEPSAILGFRDEFPELVGNELAGPARELAQHCMTIEEYLVQAYKAGRIDRNWFTGNNVLVKLHGHCQQKSIASTGPTIEMLSIPVGYHVEEIPSGCCGMAGSFGYEKEHYDIAMKVGELILFPAVRHAPEGTVIAAPGTSCRHQILDGTGKRALHPVEVLYGALK